MERFRATCVASKWPWLLLLTGGLTHRLCPLFGLARVARKLNAKRDYEVTFCERLSLSTNRRKPSPPRLFRILGSAPYGCAQNGSMLAGEHASLRSGVTLQNRINRSAARNRDTPI